MHGLLHNLLLQHVLMCIIMHHRECVQIVLFIFKLHLKGCSVVQHVYNSSQIGSRVLLEHYVLNVCIRVKQQINYQSSMTTKKNILLCLSLVIYFPQLLKLSTFMISLFHVRLSFLFVGLHQPPPFYFGKSKRESQVSENASRM